MRLRVSFWQKKCASTASLGWLALRLLRLPKAYVCESVHVYIKT